MATTDKRKLEKTKTPGIYRRHANGCKRRCKCPYVVVWKQGGKQHKQMFATYELAREHKGELDWGKTTRRPLSSDTVAAHYERWLPRYRGRTSRGLEQSTRREYEISFRLHILPLSIGRMKMRDVAAPDVRDWIAQLERRGASPGTIRRAKAALSVMLAGAVEDGDIGSNPAVGVRYVPSDAAKRRHSTAKRRELTAADITALLRAMDDEWRAFFMLLAESGLRVGEAMGLTWEHVHLGDDPHVVVAEQIYRGRRKQLKTDASEARVPLSSTMASWLAELRPDKADLSAPVFPSRTGTALTYANVYNRVLRPALRDSGLAVETDDGWNYQGVAFHAFRKACGSLLLASGKNLKQVQGWLRHSKLTTTLDVYTHQVDDGLGTADVWENILERDPRGATLGQPRGNSTPGDSRKRANRGRGRKRIPEPN